MSKLRLEPEVREVSVEINAEFKRLLKLIPKSRSTALLVAVLNGVDKMLAKEEEGAKSPAGESETTPTEKVDQGPTGAEEAPYGKFNPASD